MKWKPRVPMTTSAASASRMRRRLRRGFIGSAIVERKAARRGNHPSVFVGGKKRGAPRSSTLYASQICRGLECGFMIPSDARLTRLADAASVLLFAGDDDLQIGAAVTSLDGLFRDITGLREDTVDPRDR